MRLELPQSDTFTLDRNHPLCEGTIFADMDFSIEVKRLTEADVESALEEHKTIKDKRVRIDEAAAYISLFDKAIVSWRNVCDQNGQAIPCNSDHKRKIATVHRQLRELVVLASRHALILDDEIEEAEEKN